MKNTIQFALIVAIVVLAACGGKKTTKDGFTVLKNGLEIKMLEDKKGENADSGYVSMINITVKVDDSTVFDSKQMNNNEPVMQPIQPSQAIGDLMAGFMEMSEGDKAIFRVSADSLFPDKTQRPPFVKDGAVMSWEVEMVSLKSPASMEKEKQDRIAKQDKDLKDYITKNNLDAKKTASGIYIVTTNEGSGDVPISGQIAVMNYTGYLLDGSVFDSNMDPKFNHTDPFEFPVGQGRVIKGWDEGVAQLKKGAKAKLIIPSDLAYGERATPPSDASPNGIPANSPLVFDVEVLDIKNAEAAPQQPQISADGTVIQ